MHMFFNPYHHCRHLSGSRTLFGCCVVWMRASSFKACSNHYLCRSFAQALARGNIIMLQIKAACWFFCAGLARAHHDITHYYNILFFFLRGLSPREILLCVGLARAPSGFKHIISWFCAGLAHANHSFVRGLSPRTFRFRTYPLVFARA